MHRALAFLLRPPPSEASPSIVAVRAATGLVFVVSGAIKFVFENQGELRFAKIGLSPALAYPVGAVEIVAGLCLLCGFLTRLAALPLMIDMIVALVTTKLPLLVGPGPEPLGAPPKMGMWAFAYQARLDLTMLLSCGYLLAVGAGVWSLDAWLSQKRSEQKLLGRVRSAEA